MTNTLLFTNQGELDPNLITILGTNVKEGESPIGTFGTGLKYAIAVTLRLGGKISIQTGRRTHFFSAVPTVIRGKTFGVIYMETASPEGRTNEKLGFTTDLGKNWQPWMAFRELYCNALDEPEGHITIVASGTSLPQAIGRTNIYVNCPEILDAYRNRNEWFLFTGAQRPEALAATPKVELYPNRGDNAYFYRGIKVGEYTHRPRFTYNFVDDITLTEDRTCHEVHTYYILAREVYSSILDPNVLSDIIVARDDGPETMESSLPWNSCYGQPSEALLTLLRDKQRTKRALLPKYLMLRVAPHLPKEPPEGVYLTDLQTETLVRAKNFLRRIGIEIRRRVIVLESLGGGNTGLITDGVVYIALAVVESGPKAVAANLLTEWLISEQDFPMGGQEMTDWLVHKVLAQAEEMHNTLV